MNQDLAIRRVTAAAVVGVAAIAAYISYRHAYELAITHGESASTGRAWPLTVDGLIFAASMVLLDSARAKRRPPWLAYAGLAAGILATLGANVAHGWGHGPIGAMVAAWPALALVGSYELLMWLVRSSAAGSAAARPAVARTLEEQVVAAFEAGASQRQIARDLPVNRHQVKAILDQAAAATDQPADERPAPARKRWLALVSG